MTQDENCLASPLVTLPHPLFFVCYASLTLTPKPNYFVNKAANHILCPARSDLGDLSEMQACSFCA